MLSESTVRRDYCYYITIFQLCQYPCENSVQTDIFFVKKYNDTNNGK